MYKKIFKGTEGNSKKRINLAPAEAFEEYKQGLLKIIKQQIDSAQLNADFDLFSKKIMSQHNSKIYTAKREENVYFLYYSQELFANRVFNDNSIEKSTSFYLIRLEEEILKSNIEKKYSSKLMINFREGLLSDNKYRIAEKHLNDFIFQKFGQGDLYENFGFNKKEVKEIQQTVQKKSDQLSTGLNLTKTQKTLLQKDVEKIYLLFIFLTDMYGKSEFKYNSVDQKLDGDKEYSAYMLWHDVMIARNQNSRAYCNDITNLAVRILQHPLFADSVLDVSSGFVVNSKKAGVIYDRHTALIVSMNIGNTKKQMVIDIDDAKKTLRHAAREKAQECFDDKDTLKIKYSDNIAAQARYIVNYGFNNKLNQEIGAHVLNMEEGNLHFLYNLYAVGMKKWQNFQDDEKAIEGIEEFLKLLNSNTNIDDEGQSTRLIIGISLQLLLHLYYSVYNQESLSSNYRENTWQSISASVKRINEIMKISDYQLPLRQNVINDIRSLLNMLPTDYNKKKFISLMQLAGGEYGYD